MHIVHVTEVITGGVYVWLRDVCKHLVADGWKVTVIYNGIEGDEEHFNIMNDFAPGINLIPVDIRRSKSPIFLMQKAFNLSAVLSQLNPDVIHLHSSFAGILGRFAAIISGQKNIIIYSPHGLAFLRKDVSSLARSLFWLGEWVGARFGGVGVGCSAGERDMMKSLFTIRKLALVENAIDTSSVNCSKKTKKNSIVIGTNGRISAQKAPELYAKIVIELSPNSELECVWIGGGDDLARSGALQQAGIKVTGWLNHQEAMMKLCELDVYVSTALWEGMPLALIEAQVAGVPAVVTDVIGNKDVVEHGITGFIAKTNDELSQYVQILIDDRELRRQLGANARERAIKRFDIHRMVNELEILYEGVIQANKLQ